MSVGRGSGRDHASVDCVGLRPTNRRSAILARRRKAPAALPSGVDVRPPADAAGRSVDQAPRAMRRFLVHARRAHSPGRSAVRPEPPPRRGAGAPRRAAAADPLPRLGPQQPQPARADRAHRARPHGRGRGGRQRRGDGGGRRPAHARADRLPDPQDDHPRVDLVAAPLPDRAPGPGRRSRPVVAGLGDRARRGGVGRDRPAGHRRGRRRRRVGHAHVPHARGRQEQPVSPRGPARRDRAPLLDAMAGLDEPRLHAAPARLRRPGGERPAAAADPPARARDRLDRGRDDADRAPDPRRRGPPRRARHDRGRAVPPVRRPPRARPARVAGRGRRHPPRRDLPRDRRRRRLDHPPQAPRALQAARHPRARARRRRARRPRDRRAGPRARSRTATPGARSPTRSTTASAPALRLLQRRDEHRPMPPAARRLPLRAQPAPDAA